MGDPKHLNRRCNGMAQTSRTCRCIESVPVAPSHDDDRPAVPPRDEGIPAAPRPLLIAAVLVGVEAVALVVYGVVETFSITGARVAMGVTTSVFFVLYGIALGWFARELLRRQSWARAPLVLAQLIQLGVAWSFRGGAGTAVAAVLAVLALGVLAGIFHPASIRALDDH